ncbi:MAG: sigma-70 family RNA polymerase sigma factor [Actinomycetota bacterium]
MSEHESDAALLEQLARGERGAFDEIVNRYERRVYAVALRMCANPDDARDVTQEVFCSALRSLKRFRQEARLSTWFHRVAVNASLDYLRKASKRPVAPIDAAEHLASDAAGPEELAGAATRAVEVQRALTQLSGEHRAVLVLHDLQGLDYAEVAAVLDIPVGTVKSRVHRARAEIAGRLGHLRSTTTEPSSGQTPLTEEP